MHSLEGKVALVTGAGQGVGQGIALALAAAGTSVLVTGRTLEKLEQTVAMIAERDGKAMATTCNVKDVDDLERIVRECLENFGGLNILVNNAQEVPLGTLEQVSDEAFTAGFESGPLATMRLMKIAYPHLKGDGCIVNLASTAARRWDMVGYGAVLGVVILIIDRMLEKKKTEFRAHLMPIAVGIYLPFGLSVPIFLGGLLAHVFSKGKTGEEADKEMHRGVLFSSGIIAGESLMGVGLALLAAAQVGKFEFNLDSSAVTGITWLAIITTLAAFWMNCKPKENGAQQS